MKFKNLLKTIWFIPTVLSAILLLFLIIGANACSGWGCLGFIVFIVVSIASLAIYLAVMYALKIKNKSIKYIVSILILLVLIVVIIKSELIRYLSGWILGFILYFVGLFYTLKIKNKKFKWISFGVLLSSPALFLIIVWVI